MQHSGRHARNIISRHIHQFRCDANLDDRCELAIIISILCAHNLHSLFHTTTHKRRHTPNRATHFRQRVIQAGSVGRIGAVVRRRFVDTDLLRCGSSSIGKRRRIPATRSSSSVGDRLWHHHRRCRMFVHGVQMFVRPKRRKPIRCRRGTQQTHRIAGASHRIADLRALCCGIHKLIVRACDGLMGVLCAPVRHVVVCVLCLRGVTSPISVVIVRGEPPPPYRIVRLLNRV